jgi:hypothetical protein
MTDGHSASLPWSEATFRARGQMAQKNVVLSPAGLRTERDYAVEEQQQQ